MKKVLISISLLRKLTKGVYVYNGDYDKAREEAKKILKKVN